MTQIPGRGLAVACILLLGIPLASSPPAAARDVAITRLDDSEAARLGWSPGGLDAAIAYAGSLGTDALLVTTDGRPVAALGDLARPLPVQSVRKAFLSALVGQHAGPGPRQIPLGATLDDLGIDDAPTPLAPTQRRATVLDLLKSISGINHPAAAEQGMQADKDRRLGHGENTPGTVWAYNNWDYNALTTIFETRTGMTVAQAFAEGIAGPVGMQDFTPDAVTYLADPTLSRHKAAMFRMSARDLARFGELYLNGGVHDGRPILPEGWVGRIATDYTVTGKGGLNYGHGYLWWVPTPATGLPDGTFWAMGLGFQAIFVIPAWRTVIVHQADMTAFWKRLRKAVREDGLAPDAALDQLILSCLGPATRGTRYCKEDRFILRREFAHLVGLLVTARR